VRIAVSVSAPSLDAQVDPRFGRAPYFLLVDPETWEWEALPNQAQLQAPQGAGIQAAAMLARHRPAAVLTGHCGPKAFYTLKAAGVEVIVGVAGSVREAVAGYRAGKYAPAKEPDVTAHWR